MAKTNKKAASSMIDKILKDVPDNKSVISWRNVEIEVKTVIGLLDAIEFVNDVVTMCYNDVNGFMPELLEFAINCGIFSKYTNLTLPESLEQRYDLVYRTDLAYTIREHVSSNQLADLIESVNKKLNSLCVTGISEVRKQIDELVSALGKAQEGTAELFESISADDISNLVSAFSNGKIDEEKLVQAYTNAMKANNHRSEADNNA